MITIIKDINLIHEIAKYDIIFIGTNVYCTLSQGIQRDIAINYGYVRQQNLDAGGYGDVTKLGKILECKQDNEPTIVLGYIYRGYPYRKTKDEDYLDYDALKKCLSKINKLYKGKKIGTTLLGCSRFDGNGNKDRVLEIMEKVLTDTDVYVYDFFQKSRDEKQQELRKKELEIKKIDRKLYYETVRKRKKEADERFKKNGFARY